MKELKHLYAEKREIFKELAKEQVGSPAYGQLHKKLQEKKKEILEHPEYKSLITSVECEVRMIPTHPQKP